MLAQSPAAYRPGIEHSPRSLVQMPEALWPLQKPISEMCISIAFWR
jgi:hypothetical protein